MAFFDASHGLLGGQMITGDCKQSPCTNVISYTPDGGRTWRLVYKAAGAIAALTATADGHAWASVGRCPQFYCRSQLVESVDGGRHWAFRGGPVPALSQLAFVSPSQGWAIHQTPGGPGPQILKTTDGGRTWRSLGRPCAAFGALISFVNLTRGSMLCTGEPGAGDQARELLATSDGGATWTPLAGSLHPWSGKTLGRGLDGGGYPQSLFFLQGDRGWLGVDVGASILSSSDGGIRWHLIASALSDYQAGPLWFIDNVRGFAIAGSGDRLRLLRTTDGGRSWSVVHRWRGPI